MSLTDIFSGLGGLEKLKITAFKDLDWNRPTKTYVVMYNPTSYSSEVKTKWIPEEGASPDGKELQFKGNTSDTASFEFLFDATGASPPGNDEPGNAANLAYLGDALNRDKISGTEISAIDIINKDKHVDRAIREFIAMASTIQGQTHSANYLQINWGAYQCRGVMTGATVNYKLFNSAGLPIRATVTANFEESISRDEQAAEAARESPDLTRQRVVKSNDTLPLMAQSVYDDPLFYLELAKANKLTNFRRLRAGQRLILPPVQK